jgi:hypothetical protein
MPKQLILLFAIALLLPLGLALEEWLCGFAALARRYSVPRTPKDFRVYRFHTPRFRPTGSVRYYPYNAGIAADETGLYVGSWLLRLRRRRLHIPWQDVTFSQSEPDDWRTRLHFPKVGVDMWIHNAVGEQLIIASKAAP